MNRFFCSISIFIFLCVLSLGYYKSYQAADRLEKERAAAVQEEKEYGIFYLREKNGLVMVYEGDQKTLYEPTNISVKQLPDALQREISAGKYLRSQEELYGFLENYSS